MDQVLAKIFRYIPEWMFVIIIIAIVLGLITLDNPMASICETQIADFTSGQSGKIFPRAVKVLNPSTNSIYFENILVKNRNRCVESINGAGCYAYFKTIQDVLNDFKKLKKNCLMELSQKPIMQKLFSDYLSTMSRLAWGETPPKSERNKSGWLMDSELKTFCQVKKYYNLFYPPSLWESLVGQTMSTLVTDPRQRGIKNTNLNASEINIKDRLSDPENPTLNKPVMELKKAYELSLFSFDCLYYQ